jgi:hypothetical protein
MCLNVGHFFGTPFRQKSFLGQPCEALRALKEEHHTEGTEVTDVELECSDPKFIRSPNRHRRKLHFRLERFGNFDSFQCRYAQQRVFRLRERKRGSRAKTRVRSNIRESSNCRLTDRLGHLRDFQASKLRSQNLTFEALIF